MMDYRKNDVTGYNSLSQTAVGNGCLYIYIEVNQTAADTQQQCAAEMEEECQKNSLKKRRQQGMLC